MADGNYSEVTPMDLPFKNSNQNFSTAPMNGHILDLGLFPTLDTSVLGKKDLG